MTPPPDRQGWLRERRVEVEAQYDAEALEYGDDPYPTTSHEAFVRKLLETCPPGGTVLDAPCGTGGYFELVREAGRRVVGIDQSAGMLAQARARGIATRLEPVGLQELAFDAEFDAAMTIDAMENVPPEDWPVVLANLHRALRPHLPYGRGDRRRCDRRRVRGHEGPGSPGRPRREHRGRHGRLSLLPGPRTGPALVGRRGPGRDGRGVRPGERMGLPPPAPAKSRVACSHQGS
jgi:SAM-dependent methyltransferase